jgi:hypothetical protein
MKLQVTGLCILERSSGEPSKMSASQINLLTSKKQNVSRILRALLLVNCHSKIKCYRGQQKIYVHCIVCVTH